MRTAEKRTRHNESRLRRQAERGGAGQCTSHSRPRSRRDPSLTRARICAPYAANEMRSRGASRNPRTARDSVWDHRFFGIGDRGHIAAAAAAVWPQYRFGTAVIYRTLLRRLGDHCENYGVIIARERSTRFALTINVDQRTSARSWTNILERVTRLEFEKLYKFTNTNLMKNLLEIEQRIFF